MKTKIRSREVVDESRKRGIMLFLEGHPLKRQQGYA